LINNADNPYVPIGTIRDWFQCRDKASILEGPAGTGKTLAMLTRIYLILAKYPGTRALLLRKTRASQTNSTLVTWENLVVPEGHPCLTGASKNVRQIYKFSNKSELVIGGLDKAERHLSSEWDIIAISQAEEISQDDFGTIMTRLRGMATPYKCCFMDCNPSAASHWLNQPDNGVTRFRTTHKDNPRFWSPKAKDWTKDGREYLATLESTLSGVWRKRLLEGKWCSAEGQIYEGWNPATHIIPDKRMRDYYFGNEKKDIKSIFRKHYITIDWGFSDPTCIQFWFTDNDSRLYLMREVYKSKITTSQIIGEIARFERTHPKIPISKIICDSAEPDRIKELVDASYPAVGTKKTTIIKGIEYVIERLKVQEDGKPRLFVTDRLYNDQDSVINGFIHEIESYVWHPSKEMPAKSPDHSMDALRYMCTFLDRGGMKVAMPSDEAWNSSLPDTRVREDIWQSI